jgi:predicted helicase
MTSLRELLDHYRDTALNERDKGDKFERLTKFFLENDTRFKERFSDVWIWNKFPLNQGKIDTGIDVVAKERYSEEYCAIQCKFYGENNVIDKPHIDSFFTASGKSIYSSRLIFTTTDNWTRNAEDALHDQKIPVNRVTTDDMENGSIDWQQFDIDKFYAPQRTKNNTRPHQQKAIDDVLEGFKTHKRGKMIMACGTGKTFTSLKLVEQIKGNILFLAPSISLVSQTFNEWILQSRLPINSLIVCSDKSIKADDDDINTYDLIIPPTTDAKKIVDASKNIFDKNELNVIFCTYQSIDVIINAQQLGLEDFDIVICDEAHRTTGIKLSDRDDSHFTKVHNAAELKSKRRLYMTATPRIYAESTKNKADGVGAVTYSMDKEEDFGPQFHYLGFGEAVEKDLLSDYKVMVLGVEEEYANKMMQENNEIQIDDDVIKIIGCWNGLAKRLVDDENEGNPMRRAVAFSRSIKDSQKFTNLFSKTIKDFAEKTNFAGDMLHCEVDHIDGTMSSVNRQKKISWLKEDTSEKGNICRILSNAKCLSEGVDVPTLDAVLFLNPRNSIVDVVQSVGRAMRKAEGKKYGYIIIPITISANIEPDIALNDNKKYKVVWDVCQALRAHDDRFEATINKINLNKNKPSQIEYSQIGEGTENTGPKDPNDSALNSKPSDKPTQLSLNLPTAEVWQNAIFGKIAKKCGDRDYWENWAKDISIIAEKYIERIRKLVLSSDEDHKTAFDKFVKGLRKNINPSVTPEDAIEMLAQHLITRPVFDALFEGYEFTKKNPVSKSMQKMVDYLQNQSIDAEQKTLDKFYESVRKRASGIDNAAAKQTVIKELYDNFFNLAFPKMAERLGIVYTPTEIVDFLIHSADYILRKEFGKKLSDKNVHILDPFTGTGTFIVRLLQSGLIKKEDIQNKYLNEIHANEIVLLAYYIAAINIEETFHDLRSNQNYLPFDGIVLTDTFQIGETKNEFDEKMFPENNLRVKRQNESPIQVIIGNPPYSVGQESTNDSNKNMKYDRLDNRIKETYVANSTSTNKNSLYDSYIKSIRWASDRIKDNGIICFVTNGSFIDSNSTAGFRKCLENEFSSLFIFNLRGNQRTSGEISRKEGGKIFGSGSRTQVAISILVKNSKKNNNEIFYYDIGDYLSREEKLSIISNFKSIESIGWEKLNSNDSNDWINKRNPIFQKFLSLNNDGTENFIFTKKTLGVGTARDSWTTNFSKKEVEKNMHSTISFYNSQVEDFKEISQISNFKNASDKIKAIEKFINNDPKKISWSSSLIPSVGRENFATYDSKKIRPILYRPFTKEFVYYDQLFNHRVSQMPEVFPTPDHENIVIMVNGVGVNKPFSSLMCNLLPDVQLKANGQGFPLYIYEQDLTKESRNYDLYETHENRQHKGFVRKDNISDKCVDFFNKKYADGSKISKLDIFYYIYGILHSEEYKKRFESDLKKMFPRVPLVKDFWAFSKSGKILSNLHVNYELLDLYPLQQNSELDLGDENLYKISKLYFGKSNGKEDKTTIIYNNSIVLSKIPLEAYEYFLNGRSAIEWIIDRYQISLDKDSGITNNPNNWANENNDPQYILNLIKRVVTLSIESVKIIKSLPQIEEII